MLAALRDDDHGDGFRHAYGGTDSEDGGDDEEEGDDKEEVDEEDEEDDLIDVLSQALELGLLTLHDEEMLWNAVDDGEMTEEELLAKWKPRLEAASSSLPGEGGPGGPSKPCKNCGG